MTWIASLLICMFLLVALRQRKRLSALPPLPPSDDPVWSGHCFLTLKGVFIDEDTRRAASAYARSAGLDVLDLVPASSHYSRLLFLADLIDPRRYRASSLTPGRTAGQAILVTKEIADKLCDKVSPFIDGESDDLGAFTELAIELKRHAATKSDIAVAPRAIDLDPDIAQRRTVYNLIWGPGAGLVLLGQLVVYVQMALCLWFQPRLGLVVLAVHNLQPILATAGLPALQTRGLFIALLLRYPIELWIWLRTFLGRRPPEVAPHRLEGARLEYQQLMKNGLDDFFLPRLETCPLCGNDDVKHFLTLKDYVQHKPGRFSLDQCRDCGHIFQNPRLSVEGLNFYYKDFYDGFGEKTVEQVFASNPDIYLKRARTVEGLIEPRRWLDVGGGHGHFCLLAREVWPDTRFDMLDLSDSVERARQRGWCDKSFRGLFPQLATDMRGQYDVVSMSHYLEHTIDPEDEIKGAREALARDGMLMIEVPDPESPFGRIFRSFWLPWFQPQHLHFFSVNNLKKLLAKHHFETVKVLRAEANQPSEWRLLSAWTACRLAPTVDRPWVAPAGHGKRLVASLVWTAWLPFFALASILDLLMKPLVPRLKLSNTYRLVARKL